ncbi:MAG TPA: prephenate dehydrogenase/arogenate dehydrogenase family protein, partial [Acidobacteriaceae bacterium]|nr:prephenate dehydrogenase/arogenate dehydrogenase family protein [Acidobacteriaceae bacterium]
MMRRVLIVGTGLIGGSIGLALRAAGFEGEIVGTGPTAETLKTAQAMGAIDSWCAREEAERIAPTFDVIVLCGPVLSILDWMQRLAPLLGEHQLVTDVGSTKVQIAELAAKLYSQAGRARFLPGHPMAGKESGGAARAEATLFEDAMWLFTPVEGGAPPGAAEEWRAWVGKFGARTMDLNAARHDEICAWVSHLPQMLSTALAALLEETFAEDATGREEIAAIGGRALRETTRLGASPY